jgi:predicted translin family RNA/ssDNA-binding protein
MDDELSSIFGRTRDKLDAHYDRRERLVKISRDITALAKKMIFALHRIQGSVKALPSGITTEVDQKEKDIQRLLEKALPDLQGPNADRYTDFNCFHLCLDINIKFHLAYRNM